MVEHRTMTDVQTHYATHLGAIYAWMAGDFEAGCAANAALFTEVGLKGETALDLGCGHGFQAVPLARNGFQVTAIDTCETLLETLRVNAKGLAIQPILGDISAFEQLAPGPFDTIVCMGDTLTHLPTLKAVEDLFHQVFRALSSEGVFVISLRDYVTRPLVGAARFIPVKSDADRILTCFVEYLPETVRVHDLLLQRHGSGWTQTVSSYQKLRLDPVWVLELAQKEGLELTLRRGQRGLLTLAFQR